MLRVLTGKFKKYLFIAQNSKDIDIWKRIMFFGRIMRTVS
jgi:hypothetical protein